MSTSSNVPARSTVADAPAATDTGLRVCATVGAALRVMAVVNVLVPPAAFRARTLNVFEPVSSATPVKENAPVVSAVAVAPVWISRTVAPGLVVPTRVTVAIVVALSPTAPVSDAAARVSVGVDGLGPVGDGVGDGAGEPLPACLVESCGSQPDARNQKAWPVPIVAGASRPSRGSTRRRVRGQRRGVQRIQHLCRGAGVSSGRGLRGFRTAAERSDGRNCTDRRAFEEVGKTADCLRREYRL